MSVRRFVFVLCIGWWLCVAAASSAAAVIRVGINASYPPFETVDDHGRLSGFDIDLVNAWAKHQGVQVKFVNLAWPHLLESLTQGRVDMVVSAVAVTAERSKAFAFSRPYYYEPQVMVLSAGRRVQNPRSLTSVGVLSGSSSLVWLTRLKLRSDAVKLYDGLPPMISDLSAGKIQAAFGDQHAMRRVSASDPNLHQLSQPEFGQDAYAFVVRKGQRALLERANKGLAALETSGTLARLKLAYPGL